MKLLAISDTYIPAAYMQQGLASLGPLGVEVEVRHWGHPTLIALQEANLAIEKGGPDAVPLPAEITDNVADFEILVSQFAGRRAADRVGRALEGDRRGPRRHGKRRREDGHLAGHCRAEYARPQRPGGGRVYDGPDPRRGPQHRPGPCLL